MVGVWEQHGQLTQGSNGLSPGTKYKRSKNVFAVTTIAFALVPLVPNLLEIPSQFRKLPRKWRKCNLVSGHGLRGSQFGRAMNWMDGPRTSADERMLSGRRAVVIA